MIPVKIKVRLYSKIDKDLMALYKHPHFSLVKAFAKVIEMSARENYHYIKLPEHIAVPEIYPKKIEFEVTIRDDETDVITWWRSIPPFPKGSRNDTLKQMLRGYLTGPVLMTVSEKTGITYFNSDNKSLIECPKTSDEIRTKYDSDMQKIKDILSQNGQTPEALLSLLSKNNKEEKEKELQKNAKKESISDSSKIQQETPATVNIIKEPAKEDDETDFDLMNAIGNLL